MAEPGARELCSWKLAEPKTRPTARGPPAQTEPIFW